MLNEKDPTGYLYEEIERVRGLLASAVQLYGLSSAEALYYSEELNTLILHAQLQNRQVLLV